MLQTYDKYFITITTQMFTHFIKNRQCPVKNFFQYNLAVRLSLSKPGLLAVRLRLSKPGLLAVNTLRQAQGDCLLCFLLFRNGNPLWLHYHQYLYQLLAILMNNPAASDREYYIMGSRRASQSGSVRSNDFNSSSTLKIIVSLT